jgi:hypothetical protein
MHSGNHTAFALLVNAKRLNYLTLFERATEFKRDNLSLSPFGTTSCPLLRKSGARYAE